MKVMCRVLRLVFLLVPCFVLLPGIMFAQWVLGEPWVKHAPRWTWQLVWYGPTEAEKMP